MPLPSIIEELSPETIGEDRITLTLDPTSLSPRAFSSVLVNVDYSRCAPDGVVLPLEIIIQAPTAGNAVPRIARRAAPASIAFTPREGGLHGVTLREIGHNRWVGKLRIWVAGDPLTGG